jgi:hypothetical protein
MNFFSRISFKEPERVKAISEDDRLPEVEAGGTTGTEISGGYIQEEYLRALSGRDGQQAYKDIARSDYNAKMCIDAVKNSIRSTPTEIRISKDDEDGEKKRLLCERVISDILTPKSRMIDEMLSCIESGFYTGEVTFENKVNNPITDPDGKVLFQSYTSIKDIAYRAQNTIEKWITDDHGRLLGANQVAYGDLDVNVDIMADSLVHFALGQLGSNFEGISMLRPAYGCYVRKNKYLKFNAIGIEKYAVPFVVGTMPVGADAKDKSNFSKALQAVVASAKSFIRLGDGYTVESGNITYDPSKVEVSIDKEDMRMTRAFLANFLLLGQTGEGSRAVSNDLGDFFINGLEYIANKVEDAINRELKRVQIANMGEQSEYAKFKFVGISDRFGEAMARLIQGLAASGIIIADDRLEDSLRKRIGLPDADRDNQRLSVQIEKEEEKVSLSEKVMRRWQRANK